MRVVGFDCGQTKSSVDFYIFNAGDVSTIRYKGQKDNSIVLKKDNNNQIYIKAEAGRSVSIWVYGDSRNQILDLITLGGFPSDSNDVEEYQ